MAALQLRPKHRTLHNPSLVHLFSTSSTPPEPTSADQSSPSASSDATESQSSLSSYFSDVKASLKQQQQQQHRPTFPFSQRNPTIPAKPSSPLDSSFSKPSKVASLEEIRKNLSEFRLRYSVPPLSRPNSAHATTPSSESSSQHISFQELYKRNVIEKADEKGTNTASGPGKVGGSGGKHSFAAIRESLRQLGPSPGMAQNESRMADPMLSGFKNNLKLKPSTDPVPVIGGTGTLPVSVFGKERERKDMEGEKMAMKTEFVRMYSYEELGEKLTKLRPDGNKEGKAWFSLGELNERLMKLREMEDKESELRIGGVPYKDLRESLFRLRMSDDEKAKKSSIQRLDILGQLGRTPNFMLQPPKEHLVEKYFHPDNMSSAEKLKIELAKVRDEFKMSESDCGSARVQVAQLTTKIKHLSSVLHKKDKHSRKGLIGMVQMRKRLLKYLRRTDWDSYCLVLSKLGLRDNPNYKN
ncbi:uncharacterized protein LOC122284857 [Carya illinoinensis]|uniref:Small ribosomal subunit protein uS15c n=1 Tax=Carya illinoinensis TaxID=32201 RepID=A0A8T1RTJ0_CARIL|nr:uncharacterized protein LOC122284857 [Carya illinoinensis]KAG6669553.1 hypothetical protein CIPAW_01G252100 [Carya illinoinensis]KAG6734058.1 hypothetical protein I3842_01G253700 [Carya illinoinensis]